MKVKDLSRYLEDLTIAGKGNYDVMIALDKEEHKNNCDLINGVCVEPINDNIGRVFLTSVNSIGWK